VIAGDKELKVPGDNPLYHCEETKNDLLNITNVDISPNPFKAGDTLTIEASGRLAQDVEDGAYALIVIKLGSIPILRRKEDLCDQAKNVDKECPLEKGKITFKQEVQLPDTIPPATVTVTADVYTKDDDRITCLKATVSFKRD